MTIEYEGKSYTVGKKYRLVLNLRKLPNSERKPTAVKGTFRLKKYADAEGYAVGDHYGFVFEFPSSWNSIRRIEEWTLPDAIESTERLG